MKILITGGAGFLGSHLAEKFLLDGHHVVALDDLSTGSMSNINHLSKLSEFKFIEHDVREPIDIKVDAILNFACPASPKHYQVDPVRTIETNFLGIINMLHLARKTDAKLLQASTSEIYGDPEVSPQKEDYWGNVNPIGPRSCYDEGKRAAETLCFDYRRQYSLDARVVRIFNTYGPKMEIGDGRVVSNFVVQALQGLPVTIYGEGTQTRSFCYVDDLVEGISRALFIMEMDSPINLGNPSEFTMLELAQRILFLTNSSSEIVFETLPVDDPRQRKPDIELANSKLGWSPKVDLDTGLMKTINYFRSVLD
jgi:UDP-glucuronate decarboxylase